jgi:lysophospholipase L1-like esterase
MNNKKSSKSRILLFQLITIVLSLIVIWVIGEVIFRLNPKWANERPARAPYNYRVIDEVYGWHVQEGYKYQGTLLDQCDSAYIIDINFGKNGFRCWGNPSVVARKKVLFLGDSYTACIQTSDDKLFYKILGDSLPIEVFAFGAAGFGSTQQWLFLEKYLQEVKPDMVVWQFCSNDFIDNYWELEKVANYHVRMKRPYTLEDGTITHQLVAEYPRNVRPFSHFLYYILKRIAINMGTFDKPRAESAEKWINEKNLDYPLFAKSVKMTEASIKKVKAILPPKTKLVAFDADNFNPQYEQIKRLCTENQIPFAYGVAETVSRAKDAGQCVYTDDGYHWNNRGNKIVADYLKPFLEQNLNN